jgi:DNA-binding response OmpR family regulator
MFWEGFVEATVLIVSDIPEAGQAYAYSLRQKGLEIWLAASNAEALETWSVHSPDLILIDSHREVLNEAQLCQQLRSEAVVPILVFASRSDEAHLLAIYQTGADEVVPNPISLPMLHAKVFAWLQRSSVMLVDDFETLQVADLTFDPLRRQLTLADGSMVRLTGLESRLLHLLMRYPGRVFETEYIVARVWGHYGLGDSVLLKNVVYRLRRKIEPDASSPRYILTEAGVGYKFKILLE